MRSRAQDLSPVAIRERILDAAEACLVESGYSSRLHAVISERAGLSRPTVYKYVGDQSEIFEALFQREITRFFALLAPVLRDSHRLDTGLTDCVVFAVGYARRHVLLQKGLRDDPAVVLPWFTVLARPFVERGTDYLAPLFERLMTAEQLTSIDPRAVCEWAFRLVASLITTGGVVDSSSDVALREFVTGLLSIGVVPAPVVQLV
jgi:AcrR family transcriptional regulator